MRVAVVGARGQLGAGIVHELCRYGHEVFAFDRATLDITRPASVEEHLARVGAEVIINCAAYNAVDAAEDDPVAALRVNAFAVRTSEMPALTFCVMSVRVALPSERNSHVVRELWAFPWLSVVTRTRVHTPTIAFWCELVPVSICMPGPIRMSTLLHAASVTSPTTSTAPMAAPGR